MESKKYKGYIIKPCAVIHNGMKYSIRNSSNKRLTSARTIKEAKTVINILIFQAKMRMCNAIESKLKRIFEEHGFSYDYLIDTEKKEVIIDVYDGDWKHDHRRLINVMHANNFIMLNSKAYDSDDDSFTATYVFYAII